MRWQLIGGVMFPVASIGGALFASAWTLDWPRAWIFVAVIAALAIATMASVFATQPELLAERYKPPVQAGQPLADRILTPLIGVTFFALVVAIPRDVFRWNLLGHTGMLGAALGLAVFVAGWLLIALAFRANAFAAPVVKHLSEQQVVDRGPYRVVRHPMYAAAILLFVGMPLWLGSVAGAVFAIVPLAPLIGRIVVEERMLRRTLPGYADYARRVRWRIVPGLW